MKSLPNAPLRTAMGNKLRGWQNGIQGTQAHGACECFSTCRTREGRSDRNSGKELSLQGMGELGGINCHLTERPLPTFSYLVISANAVLSPAVAVSSGHYHPGSINEETRAEVTHSMSSGPLAPKPLPFLDQENRPE